MLYSNFAELAIVVMVKCEIVPSGKPLLYTARAVGFDHGVDLNTGPSFALQSWFLKPSKTMSKTNPGEASVPA